MWSFSWPASAVVGLIGFVLGIVAIRASTRGSADWWTAVAAVALGAVPPGAVVWLIV